MKDFWNFKKMVTPIIIPILFGIGVFLCIVVGIFYIFGGISNISGPISYLGVQLIVVGITFLIFGPITLRIFCEVLIILFSINDTLTDIKTQLNGQQDQEDQTNSQNEG